MTYTRKKTKVVSVGPVKIGGSNPIAVQSMTTSDTRDPRATINQILALEKAGCDIVRIAVPDIVAAQAIGTIKSATNIPIVADIHFDYRLALEAVKQGIDAIRINPGNIGDIERTRVVVDACKSKNIPIRIGVNGGSLEKNILENMVKPHLKQW